MQYKILKTYLLFYAYLYCVLRHICHIYFIAVLFQMAKTELFSQLWVMHVTSAWFSLEMPVWESCWLSKFDSWQIFFRFNCVTSVGGPRWRLIRKNKMKNTLNVYEKWWPCPTINNVLIAINAGQHTSTWP